MNNRHHTSLGLNIGATVFAYTFCSVLAQDPMNKTLWCVTVASVILWIAAMLWFEKVWKD